MSALHVACVVEGDYVPHSAAMLHSVLTQRDGLDVHVHYLHGPDLARRDADTLQAWVRAAGAQITLHDIPDAWCEGLPIKGFTGKATWYRIFLPELLPQLDRVLFLDVDLVAVDALSALWATELTGSYLAAVTNVFEPEYRHRPAELGLAGTAVYFNAGVMLMNLALMRDDSCTQRLRDYGVANAGDLLWRDQDALNVVLGAKRRALHPRWNFMNIMRFRDWSEEVFGIEALDEARRHPAIRHFEGPADNKPWHHACGRSDRELYVAHRKQTPWPRYRLEGRPSLPRRAARAARRRLARS